MKCLYRYELRYLLLKYQIPSINILSRVKLVFWHLTHSYKQTSCIWMCVWKCSVGTFLEDLLYAYNLYSTWCTVLDFY